MTPLPDYDHLKSAISKHWSPSYPESVIDDEEDLELLRCQAEDEGLSLDELLARDAKGDWSRFIDQVRKEEIIGWRVQKLQSEISRIENQFLDNKELKESLVADATEDNKIESADYQFLNETGLLDVLAEQDLSGFGQLKEVAEKAGVKSWQLSEYVETLRQELGILPIHYGEYEGFDVNTTAQEATKVALIVDAAPPITDNAFSPSESPQRSLNASDADVSNKKLSAGLLGIFLGSFGIHKFVLGYKNAGIIMLVVSLAGGVVTCGISTGVMSIIGLIEGVIYLTKSTDEFRELYLDHQTPWF